MERAFTSHIFFNPGAVPLAQKQRRHRQSNSEKINSRGTTKFNQGSICLIGTFMGNAP
jgi:hypothetical protein